SSRVLDPNIVGKEHYEIARGVQSILQRYNELQDIIAILGMDELSDEDKLIIITDIFGGSVNNEFMKYLSVRSFHLISGMNLALLISVFLDKNENTKEAIKAVLKEVTSSVKYCNEEIEFDSVSEDF
ncbi:MAG: hypothetical protein RR274_06585, partial [Erysipelotrichaceae bacterium]